MEGSHEGNNKTDKAFCAFKWSRTGNLECSRKQIHPFLTEPFKVLPGQILLNIKQSLSYTLRQDLQKEGKILPLKIFLKILFSQTQQQQQQQKLFLLHSEFLTLPKMCCFKTR